MWVVGAKLVVLYNMKGKEGSGIFGKCVREQITSVAILPIYPFLPSKRTDRLSRPQKAGKPNRGKAKRPKMSCKPAS
jgi:hypothetical protein